MKTEIEQNTHNILTRRQCLFIFVLALTTIFWAAFFVAEFRLNRLVDKDILPYGPLPVINQDFYNFKYVKKPFGPLLPLKRSIELSKSSMRNIILQSLPHEQRDLLQIYLDEILSLSEEYQIDPFWVISVMLVESKFDSRATSHKMARGLMQLMPETAQYLLEMKRKKFSLNEVLSELEIPKSNIDLGVFYLKRLLQKYRLNYSFATVAYNIGPGRLRTLLSEDSARQFMDSNYYTKVKDRYEQISGPYLEHFSRHSLIKISSFDSNSERILKL